MMASFEIHSQLLLDCHLLGRFECSYLLLHKDAALPWFILVPETRETELLKLGPLDFQKTLHEARQVAELLYDYFAIQKTNFAAIGNVVPQLHLHVVGRYETDPAWPAPVWGNLNSKKRYSDASLSALTRELRNNYALHILKQ